MKAAKFDQLFDAGEDITGQLDLKKARRPGRERQLVRENGRLIVAALAGEPPINDAQARRVLNEMEW